MAVTLKIFKVMGVNVKVAKKVLHFTKEKKEIYVAKADRGDVIGPDKIAELIAKDTGARPAQVKMILNTLTDSMITWLEEGHGVKLGNFGSFMPSVKSASSENPEEVGVKRMRLTFYPSKDLYTKVGAISYSKESLPQNEEENPETEPDNGETGGGTEMD
jgi:predicted histone-like DNA-binding protein